MNKRQPIRRQSTTTKARNLTPGTQQTTSTAEVTADSKEAIFQIIIQCHHEADQRELYEHFRAAGRRCRLLVM